MKKHERQERAYDFLQSMNTSDTFTLAKFVTVTKWTSNTAETHIQKHYSDWVTRVSPGVFKVKPDFKRITKEKFLKHSSQVKRAYTDYKRKQYSAICTYELLLPMSRETELRATLDDLFFRDAIAHRYDELVGVERLVPRRGGETPSAHRERVVDLVSSLLGGYSISLVNGRFRAGDLCTRSEAAARPQQTSRPYLIDETTASVRFIVPVAESVSLVPAQDESEGDLFSSEPHLEQSARDTRALFFAFFVEAVVRIVNGEDVIWLIEESPLGRILHTWELERD